MNSIRSSRVVLLTVVLLAAGTAAAFSVDSSGVPSQSRVGSEVTVNYTINDPFTGEGIPTQYTLHGETELENVQWTVTVLRAGTPVGQPDTFTSQSFNRTLNLNNNGDEVRVRLTGEVPAVENYTYAPEETYRVARLERVTGGNVEEVVNDTAHHYTSESRAAREAIENASAAIDAAGGNQEAADLLGNARSAYNASNFGNAQDIAGRARETAESAQQSQQLLQTALLVVGALVVLGLIAGGYYYWRSQQDEYSKL